MVISKPWEDFMLVNTISIENRGHYRIYTADNRQSCMRQLEERMGDSYKKMIPAKEKWNNRGYELWVRIS